ncbi:MAG: 2-amino-4-hydroxy-6-hydroxymethyldihydropteridine diphosphokinase [Ghiorsea sp.]
MSHAIIALGGNIGEVKASFISALDMLNHTCCIVAKSKLYQTPALVDKGAKPQPDYFNATVYVVTTLKPAALLAELHRIEALHGRERIEHWGSRTLDLDLLDYEGVTSNQVELKLPHPEIEKRLFVLLPILDIMPNWIHPNTGTSVQAMTRSRLAMGEKPFKGEDW